jgi:IS4 transposase
MTNLGDIKDYSDDLISKLYSLRWNIEVYFKKIKNTMKYELFYVHDNEEIKKIKMMDNFIYTLLFF